MLKLTLDLPAMYGDHHVTEVRRILLEMPGVGDVVASSSFQVVEISYDPAQVDAAVLTARLEQAGYLGALPAPLETGEPATTLSPGERGAAFRHTVHYQQTGQVVGFAQNVSYIGRPLWPCPGEEPMKTKEWRDAE